MPKEGSAAGWRLAGRVSSGEAAAIPEGGVADGFKVGGQGQRAGEAAAALEGVAADGGVRPGNGERSGEAVTTREGGAADGLEGWRAGRVPH